MSSLEVYVLDDDATEGVQGAVRKITDNRINFIRNDEKTNANVIRNLGISDSEAYYPRILTDQIPFITFNQFRKLFSNNSAFPLPVRIFHFMTLIVLYTLRTKKLKP